MRGERERGVEGRGGDRKSSDSCLLQHAQREREREREKLIVIAEIFFSMLRNERERERERGWGEARKLKP